MKTIVKQLNKGIAILITVIMFVCSMNLGSSADTYSVNTTRSYNVYDAKTGELIDEYTIEPNSYPTTNSTRAVIGNDERTNNTYVNGVVKIVSKFNYQRPISTGFIVDDHTIATAAHSVCSTPSVTRPNQKTIESISIIGSNGEVEYSITDFVDVHVPRAFINTGGDTNEYDYALITVSDTEAAKLKDYVCFDLGVMRDEFQTSGMQVSITGFPGEVNGVTVNSQNIHAMYTSTGTLITDQVDRDPTRQICYRIDTSGGNSGGPVYVTTEYNGNTYYTVIGIVEGGYQNLGYNMATRITTDLLHFYKNNPYI